MDACIYKVIAVHETRKGVVLELRAHQQYFKPKLKRGEDILIDDYDGHKITTRIKALVMMDEPHPRCDVGILLPPDIKIEQVKVESDVWTVEK